MISKTVGVVDYGVGNHTSVLRTFHALGHRCRVTSDREVLRAAEVIVLPGVGAFPAAMMALHRHGLADFLVDLARQGKPIIGICLGMQLLADESLEHGITAGLGLIPGTVCPLPMMDWHIGWNSLEITQPDALLMQSDGEPFYFNHSYGFDAPNAYVTALSRVHNTSFTVAVRRGNVVGLQFHPEKSQAAGKELLSRLVEGLCRA